MTTTLQSFDDIVQGMCAGLQDASGSLIDVSSGSVARALLESGASIALWVQFLNMQVLASTRLATSSGTDIDSWVGDFGLTRLAATSASGQVVMSSLNPAGSSAVIPNGAQVRTADGSVSFAVVGGPYTRPAGTVSVAVTVRALTAGTLGNVASGTISLQGSSIPGIDLVSNPVAFTNGADPETDAALRARFVAYINSRAQATVLAIRTAVQAVQLGVSCEVIENTAPDGTVVPGYFTVVMDDGSGAPPAALLDAAQQAVDAVRPIGSRFSVIGPTVIVANMQVVVEIDAQAVFADVAAAITLAVDAYVGALPVGAPLRLTRIVALAYAASAAVTNVVSVTLDGGSSDLGGTLTSVVRAGQISVVGG
ncbi:putative phage protein gp47/JayE [Endobacter medicaginis]|uniref:Baseplate J/gp47 family protein n=1 Tax=Endobacter medicaginis TaxID=1181271 RepID=A0A850NPD1_9PROT|nr:baseplate J/gp47 family protein [Endobacter medicaginis]MBB3174987.1 putative phage protein gp47/JayE [Endobacter medicaginis]MCX5475910.1 baseplate J/gp47 family protein [Endobacter medicaginis]NVN28838.1 baseplate J/gp47 family protein [Endobacter medicaginis]